MPLLVKAGQVHVVTVVPTPDEQIENSGAQIARHLARHDINTELKILPSDIDVANTLLSFAADGGANLLVMGAYGHSRYRELLLGGTTRAILKTMTLPVFMSHYFHSRDAPISAARSASEIGIERPRGDLGSPAFPASGAEIVIVDGADE